MISTSPAVLRAVAKPRGRSRAGQNLGKGQGAGLAYSLEFSNDARTAMIDESVVISVSVEKKEIDRGYQTVLRWVTSRSIADCWYCFAVWEVGGGGRENGRYILHKQKIKWARPLLCVPACSGLKLRCLHSNASLQWLGKLIILIYSLPTAFPPLWLYQQINTLSFAPPLRWRNAQPVNYSHSNNHLPISTFIHFQYIHLLSLPSNTQAPLKPGSRLSVISSLATIPKQKKT